MVLLRNRIELVVVAGGAADGQPEEHGAGRIGAVLDVLKADLFFNDAVLIRRRVVPDESGGDALVERRIRQQIAGELLDGKPIERQIAVERSDDPVAIRPDAAAVVVVVQAVGVPVPRRIEPIARAMLTVMRRRQQPVDHLRVRIRRRVCDERRDVFGLRRQSRQIQRHAPNQRTPIRFGVRREARCLDLRQHEPIDGRCVPTSDP